VGLGEVGQGYARASQLPDAVLVRPVAAGELLPTEALGAPHAEQMRVITLPVEPLHAPVDLIAGDRVDIWATPTESSTPGPSALVQASALVAQVAADSVGVGGEIGVSVEIPADRTEALISAVRGGVIDLVTVPIEAQA
jgi:hypothetical protein